MNDKFKAVLFDFDGTLMDSEPIHFEAWREALQPLGVAVEHDLFMERFVGVEDREAIRMLAELQDPPRDFEDLWATFPSKQQIFREIIGARPQVPEATKDIIADLKAAGYLLGVVTSSSEEEVVPILERNGIRPYLDTAIFRENVIHKKPHPEPYLKALEALGVDHALVLEDSKSGIAAALAAGCEVVPVVDVNEVARQVRERLGMGGGRTPRVRW